jgi:hypothetical protein
MSWHRDEPIKATPEISALDARPFYFSNVPLLPMRLVDNPEVLHYTPKEWKLQCWNKMPPECAECGSMFQRPTQKVRFFCCRGCDDRWNNRFKTIVIPTKYRNEDWPGRKEGLPPEQIRWISDLWVDPYDDENKKNLTVMCEAMCFGYPTNEDPLLQDRRGKPCRLSAGFGTEHKGRGRCKYHGGNTPTHNKQASRNLAKEIKITNEMIFGSPVDEISPEEAILQELARTAGHVEWLYQKVQLVGSQSALEGEDENKALIQYTKLGITPSVWIQMYQDERKHLMAVAKTASSMGIAERQVQIAEQQGKMLAMVIRNFMDDPLMELTPTQRVNAPELIRKHLAAIPISATSTTKRPLSSDIIQENGLSVEANQFIADQEATLDFDEIDDEEG